MTPSILEQFKDFCGTEKYNKFVSALGVTCTHRGHMMYWQEQLWNQFASRTTTQLPTDLDGIRALVKRETPKPEPMGRQQIVTILQKLIMSGKPRNEVIRDLKEILCWGEELQFGTALDAADFIHSLIQEEDAWWDDSSYSDNQRVAGPPWGQFRVFPSGRPEGGPIYFGYKINDDEFVWGFSVGRG